MPPSTSMLRRLWSSRIKSRAIAATAVVPPAPVLARTAAASAPAVRDDGMQAAGRPIRFSLARRYGPDPSGQPPRPDPLLELIEVLRLLEPATASLAAARVTDGDLAEFTARLETMAAARHDPAAFAAHDAAFHQAVASVTRNETLRSLLDRVSTHTVLAQLPRAVLDHGVADIILAEHTAIHAALEARDPTLAHAAALLHVNTSERWLRRRLGDAPGRALRSRDAG